MDISAIMHRLTPEERKQVESLLAAPTLPDILTDTFPLQREFILHPGKLKVLFCTRRSAKSYTGGLYLIRSALSRPNVSNVYIALTRDSAKRIIWEDVFKTIIKKYNIPAKFNETELSIQFPNGSNIVCVGLNDSEAEKEKLLGKKFLLAVCDEAASFDIDLNSLVYKILKPAMSDYRGTICLLGTPSDRKTGLFYNLTRDMQVSPPSRMSRDGWDIWGWDAYSNPYMREQWAETINDLKRNDPYVEDQPWYKQMYLAQWVVLDSNRIYKYNANKNAWDGNLPDHGWEPWQYVLGIDLGYLDCSALALLAWHRWDPNVYIVRAEKRKGLTFTELADWIRSWNARYPINNFIVDGANKQGVEEMVKHHNLPLQAASKSDKVNFIRIMNSDFVSGKIKVHRIDADALIEEYDKSLWDARALERGIYKEDYSFHPDLADAALYAYRYTYAYTSEARPAEDKVQQSLQDGLDDDTRRTLQRFREETASREADMWGNEYLYER